MTDDRIKAVFEEYGRIVTGKEYALIHAIAEAVSTQRTWVELTAGEISKIWGDLPQTTNEERDAIEFGFAIETALRKKNNA